MFVCPTDHSSHSATQGSSNKGYAIPDPSDCGACARFRLRRKASKTPSRRPDSTAITVSQLLQTKVELYRELNCLSEVLILQGCALNEHLLSCTTFANQITNIVTAAPLITQPHVRPEKDDTIFYDISKLAPFIPSACPSFSPGTSSSSSPTPTIPTPSHDSSPDEAFISSITSILPLLRSLFNNPRPEFVGG